MSSSICIHYALSVSASSVHHSNANAVTIRIETGEGPFDITLFNLPTTVADQLSAALKNGPMVFDEQVIRADERRKIATLIGLES